MPQPQLTGPIRFGVFEVDPRSAVVRKHGTRIRLQDQPFRVLLALLEHPGEVVTREDLQRQVRPQSTFGDVDHSLNIAINKIRETLGDSAENPRFVETIPKRGYRFIAPVIAPVESLATLAGALPAALTTPETVRKSKWIPAGLVLAVLILIAATTIWLRPSSTPPEMQVRRLTHDSSPKFDPVLSDGARLYFRAGTRTDWHIFQVPLSGGEPVQLPVVLPTAKLCLLDVAPDGQELLLTASESIDSDPLWTMRLADGSRRRVGSLSALNARYSPDGNRIAFTAGRLGSGSLSVASRDGSNASRLFELKDFDIVDPCWSPDGQRIIFGRLNRTSESASTWEMMADGSRLRPLFPNWHESHLPAGWTPDGRLILVSQGRLWTAPFRRFLHGTPALPSPISPVEPRFDSPIQIRSGRSEYAVGSTRLGQLQRFDTGLKAWEPHLGGISAQTVEYSGDGQSVAYATYPERQICVWRVDGNRLVELTTRPMQAWIPRWSPDGKVIAFLGKSAIEQPERIYLVDAAGGSPRPACGTNCGPQGDFSWAPDGKTIVFAFPTVGPRAGAPTQDYLQLLEIDTGKVTKFFGSDGLYSPRWSPNGTVLAALADRGAMRKRALMRYHPSDGKWVEAAGPASGFVSWPSWSRDSKSIWYFNRLRGTIGRYLVHENRNEDALPLKPEELSGPTYWFNLTPNDEPMILRSRDIQEIYALDWK